MRHIFKTTAIASSLVAASFFAGTGMANAQVTDDTDVIFNAEVEETCAFGTPTPGVLVLVSPNTLTSSGTAGAVTGGAGTVQLTCNGTFDLSVAEPVQTDGDLLGALTASTASAEVNGSTANVGIPAEGITAVLDETVTVNMTAQTTDLIAPGTYAFTVNVTAAPQ